MGYFTFNPFYGADLVKRFDDAFSRPFFAGFKLLCDYWQTPVTDPRFEPVWRYANERRLPILLHTWEGTCDSPALLSDIVPRYLEARFLLGHSGGGDRGRLEAERLALASPNVYLEFCGSFCAARPWEETLAAVGPDRVVFGTDGIYHDVSWELARLLSVDVPDETKVRILGANMRAVLARRR